MLLKYEPLQIGSTGDMVKILQEKLKVLGFYHGIVTGSFGLETEAGLRAFQKRVGLEETRALNEPTWLKIVQYTDNGVAPISNYPVLKYGQSGEEVIALQKKLKALLYYTNDINGNFDLETENAVKRLQANNQLTADGIVGAKTWTVLNTLYGNLKECGIDTEDNSTEDILFYTVKRGDTLYQLAKRYQVTVEEIKRLNNLTSNTIQIDQVLKIPKKNDTNFINYTVVKGDTLYQLAKKYGTSIEEIQQLNDLTSTLLSIGQILKIPVTEPDFIYYTVKKGDTLYALAKKYNTTVDELLSLNNLPNSNLKIGAVLKIPRE